MREAGDRTTWTDPDEDYETAVHAAVDAAVRRPTTCARCSRSCVDADRDPAAGSNSLAAEAARADDARRARRLPGQRALGLQPGRPGQPPAGRLRRGAPPRSPTASDRPSSAITADGTAAAPRPARAVHVVHPAASPRAPPPTTCSPSTAVARSPSSPGCRSGWRPGRLGRHDARRCRRVTWPTSVARPVSTSSTSVWSTRLADLLADLPGGAAGAGGLMRGRFDVWAPLPERVRLVVGDDVVEMTRGARRLVDAGRPGARRRGRLRLPARRLRARRCPTRGRVASPTACTSARGPSTPTPSSGPTTRWTGRQLAGSVIYELHVGTFTPEGTLDAAVERLDHLVDLGVDLVELLPVNAFNGTHNWGYDGVLWSAVHEQYGGPAAYQRFVDAAHAAGLGVIQDVVYNHLGPSGNYLPMFGPYLKTEGAQHLGLAGQPRRRGLGRGAPLHPRQRADVAARLPRRRAAARRRARARRRLRRHTCSRSSAVEVGALSAHLRPAADPDRRVRPERRAAGHAARGGRLGLDAQWSDDFHHAAARGADRRDERLLRRLRAALGAGQGVRPRLLPRRHLVLLPRPRPRRTRSTTATMPTWRLVVCHQNHDQVGNRAAGDRLTEHLDEDQLVCAALLTLAGPFTPMLFQGEEWAASTPFQFFTSHPEPELGEATAEGRLARVRADGLGPRASCPTRRTRRRSDAPSSTGRSVSRVGTRGCSRRTNASSSCDAPCPTLTDPSFASVVVHRRRGAAGVHDATR